MNDLIAVLLPVLLGAPPPSFTSWPFKQAYRFVHLSGSTERSHARRSFARVRPAVGLCQSIRRNHECRRTNQWSRSRQSVVRRADGRELEPGRGNDVGVDATDHIRGWWGRAYVERLRLGTPPPSA